MSIYNIGFYEDLTKILLFLLLVYGKPFFLLLFIFAFYNLDGHFCSDLFMDCLDYASKIYRMSI